MPQPSSRHATFALTLVLSLSLSLSLLGACADRRTSEHAQPESQPVTEHVPFQVDPAHQSQASCYAVAFAYDQPVALPPEDDGQPQAQVPAARLQKVPVVLDLSCTLRDVTVDQPPIDQVTTIRVYDEQQRQLASFVVADDAEASIQHTVKVGTDVGAVSNTIAHRRMAVPAALDRSLRATPGASVTVVGLDAQGRIALVEEADGCLDSAVGIGKGVRVGAGVVWLEQHRDYTPPDGSLYWRYGTSFDADAPVALPPEAIVGDPVPTARTVPATYRVAAPLVLDLAACTPAYRGEPPLAQAVTVYVFGKQERLLAKASVATDCWLTSSTCMLSEGAGQTVFAEEHLRVALDPATFAGMSDSSDRLLWIVAVDAEGKSILMDITAAPAVASARPTPASTANSPPRRAALGADPRPAAPTSVGVATMEEDGTLQLQLRSQEADGTIAECLLVVPPSDQRYAAMRAHLAGLKPGGSCPIPPFPATGVDAEANAH